MTHRRIDRVAVTRNPAAIPLGRCRLAICGVLTIALTSAVCGCMAVAKRLPQETALAESADETAMVAGYMRYYMVHSTYGEISRVDGESLGGSTYAATVAPGRRLIVVRMTQVSAMNPLLFGESSCAFELDAVAGAVYQLTPTDMKAYWRFWSRPPGTAPKRFDTTLRFEVSIDAADEQPMELTAECGNPAACRASDDCEFMRTDSGHHDSPPIVCERDSAERYGHCVVAAEVSAEPAEIPMSGGDHTSTP